MRDMMRKHRQEWTMRREGGAAEPGLPIRISACYPFHCTLPVSMLGLFASQLGLRPSSAALSEVVTQPANMDVVALVAAVAEPVVYAPSKPPPPPAKQGSPLAMPAAAPAGKARQPSNAELAAERLAQMRNGRRASFSNGDAVAHDQR